MLNSFNIVCLYLYLILIIFKIKYLCNLSNKLVTMAKLDDSTMPFSFPKSTAAIDDNLFVVCDTGNNRVVGFNSGGVQTFTFNNSNVHNESNHLFCPISTCVLANVYAAIADYENSTISILSQHGTKERVYMCHDQPICISSDFSNILYVLTRSQTIESYSIIGKRIRTLQLIKNLGRFYTLMAVHSKMNEIYLSESNSNQIFIINKNGSPLRNMKLNIPESGLNVFISSIYFTREKIIVSDSVNRCVLLFDSATGNFEKILLNGKNGIGCIQFAVLSPRNEIIITEFSLNQPHSVKIFSCNVSLDSEEFCNVVK